MVVSLWCTPSSLLSLLQERLPHKLNQLVHLCHLRLCTVGLLLWEKKRSLDININVVIKFY